MDEKLHQQIVVLHHTSAVKTPSLLFRALELQAIPRLESLLLQHGAVASDELTFYMSIIAHRVGHCMC